MGVDRTDYLMLGVDVGYEAFDWEKHETEAACAPGSRFDIVFDGMSGKYCLAGKIIARSDPYEGFETAVTITPETLGVDRAELAEKISSAFDGKSIGPNDLRLILFSHFS